MIKIGNFFGDTVLKRLLTRRGGCGPNRRHRSHAQSSRLSRSGLSCVSAYVRECVRVYTVCTRAVLLYFVGRARCRGRPLPLVTSGFIFHAMYFWSAPCALAVLRSRARKKEGLRKGRGSRICYRGRTKKAACHGYAKSGVCILRCLLQYNEERRYHVTRL